MLATCLLFAPCCLSTLDTKEGYKTKTGYTSSVTLALAITLGFGSQLVPGPKLESNDMAKVAMNEFWGILLSLINMVGMAEPIRCRG